MTNRHPFIIIATVVLLLPCAVFSQISQGGQPRSIKNNISSLNQIAVLPGSAAIPSALKNENQDKHGAYQFAYVFDVDYSPETSGQWDETANGEKIWRLGIESEGAYSLNIIFDQFAIPNGAELFVYNSDYSVILGAFTSENNNEANVLAIAPVSGSFIIIEYIEPKNVPFNGLLHIDRVGHDYANAFGNKDATGFGDSGSCNVDINCDEGNDWQLIKRAVCRLVFNGGTLCTATLVNNGHQNQKPYVLTANHCIDYQSDATNAVFIFNYESPSCGGGDGSVSQSMSGATLLATKNPGNGYLDFSLLLLNEKVPLSYNPYFAGWDARGTVPSKTTCIHHPKGDVKKIAIDNDAPEMSSTYAGYGYDLYTFIHILKWDTGTTEKGSSGGSLFDQNQRIIGTLTGGDANCDLSVNDYFQMFAASYNKYNADTLQLKHWLDPENEGLEYLDGFRPLAANSLASDITPYYHYTAQDSGAVYYLNNGTGYVSGNNSYGDKAKAEFFNQSEFGSSDVITGAYVWFAQAKGRPYEDIEFFLLPDNGFSEPASMTRKLGSSYLWMSEIIKGFKSTSMVYFPFYPPVEITSPVYAGIMLPQYEGDTLAIVNTYFDPSVNSAWEMDANDKWWSYFNTWGSQEKNFALLIVLEAGKYLSIGDDKEAAKMFDLMPNPASDNFTIHTNDANGFIQEVNIYNNLGQMIFTKSINHEKQTTIDVEGLTDGIYFCTIHSGNGTETLKFMVQR